MSEKRQKIQRQNCAFTHHLNPVALHRLRNLVWKKGSISGLTLLSAICLPSISFGVCRSIRRRISHCSMRCSISCLCSCHCRLSASMYLSCCCRTSTLCWVWSHWFFSFSTVEENTEHEKYQEKWKSSHNYLFVFRVKGNNVTHSQIQLSLYSVF